MVVFALHPTRLFYAPMKPDKDGSDLRCLLGDANDVRAVIYARIDSDVASEQAQVETCSALAREFGMQIAEIITDHDRRDLSLSARRDLNAAIDATLRVPRRVLLVANLSTLARQPVELIRIVEHLTIGSSALITADTEPAATAEFEQLLKRRFDLCVKRHERRTASQRALIRDKFLAGIYHGNPPYGYTTDRTSPHGLRPLEKEAKVVRRAFTMCAASGTLEGFLEEFLSLQLRNRRGELWSRSLLIAHRCWGRERGLLHREIYRGILVMGVTCRWTDPYAGESYGEFTRPEQWVRAPAPSLALVEPETYAAVQRIIASDRQGPLIGTQNKTKIGE